MRGVLVIVLVAACNPNVRELPEPLAELEAAYARTPELAKTFDPDDVILGPTGLFVHRGRRATYLDLALRVDDALSYAPRKNVRSIVVMPNASPAALAVVMASAARLRWPMVQIGAFEGGTIRPICRVRPLVDITPVGEQKVDLSIYIDAEHVWLGLNRVNEFNDIPRTPTLDVARMDTALADTKKSGFFVDREDFQLAMERQVDLATMLTVLEVAGRYFHEIAMVTPGELHARPTL